VSEGLVQGPYVAVKVRFEPATLQTQSTELTTEPLRPQMFLYFVIMILLSSRANIVDKNPLKSNVVSRY